MKQLTFFCAFWLLIIQVFGQIVITENSHIPVVDEIVYNRDVVKNGFSKMTVFYCQDTVLDKAKCRCVQKAVFDDAGLVRKIIVGKDIENGLVSFEVAYKKVQKNKYEATVKYYRDYIRKNYLQLSVDSIIQRKKKRVLIYPYEQDSTFLVTAQLTFNTNDEYADTILRYNNKGKLIEAWYPLGNRKILRQYTDSLLENGELTVKANYYYQENSYHRVVKYNARNQLIEHQHFNFTYGTQASGQKTMYVYDDSARLIFAHTTDNNDIFMYTESYKYQNGKLIEYVKNERPSDSLWYMKKHFNSNGDLQSIRKVNSIYEQPEELSLYYYKGVLKVRRDEYYNGKLSLSAFYFYE